MRLWLVHRALQPLCPLQLGSLPGFSATMGRRVQRSSLQPWRPETPSGEMTVSSSWACLGEGQGRMGCTRLAEEERSWKKHEGGSAATCPLTQGKQQALLSPQCSSTILLSPQAGCRSWPADWRPPTTWWAGAPPQGTARARVTTVAAASARPTGRGPSSWAAPHCAAPTSPPSTSRSAASPAWASATCPPTRTRRRSSPSAPCS